MTTTHHHPERPQRYRTRNSMSFVSAAVVLFIAGVLYLVPRFAHQQPGLAPSQRFAEAQRLHTDAFFDTIPSRVKLEKILGHYEAAAVDSTLRAEARYGAGQIRLALGDTDRAIADWNLAAEVGDDFQRLRAWKSSADALAASGRDSEAHAIWRRIIETYDQTDLPPAMAGILESARRRLDPTETGRNNPVP